MISHMWSLKYETNELIYKTATDIKDVENRTVIAKEVELGKEWIGSLGLANANYHV